MGALEQYISEQIQAGYSAQQIEAHLLAHGYPADTIAAAFASLSEERQQVPHHHFHIIAFLSLVLVAVAITMLIVGISNNPATPPEPTIVPQASVTTASLAEETVYAQAKAEGLIAEDCVVITDDLLKNLCWQEISLQQNNVEFCERSTTTRMRDECLYTHLINDRNVSCDDFLHFENVYACEQYKRLI